MKKFLLPLLLLLIGITQPVQGLSPKTQTICYGATPELLVGAGDDTHIYRWQRSYDGGSTWTTISGETGPTYQPPALTQTTTFMRSSSTGRRTGNATVYVYDPVTSGSISANQTICHGTVPSQINGTVPSGGAGEYTYQWQISTNGASWSNISGAIGQNYQPLVLTQTTYYRRQAIDLQCGPASGYSNIITITVRSVLAIGSISANQTICNGAAPNLINGTTPTGGSGSYTYQWQSSTNGSTWNSISGATGQNYQPPALTQTTYYRRHVVDSQCGNGTSNTVTITVRAALSVGSITTNQTICHNIAPARIDGTVATGGAGSYTYQWQSSPNGTSWSNISNATALNYQPPALTQTTYYRRQTTDSQCGNGYSNNVIITVRAVLSVGSISSEQTICYNSAPARIEGTMPTGGAGSYSYQWQSSTNGTSWSNINGGTGQNYQPPALTANRYYRRQVTDSQCGNGYTNHVLIIVRAILNAGAIGSNHTVCYNSPSELMNTTTAPSGGTGSFTYQWRSSLDGIYFADIPGATTQMYQSENLIQRTFFKRKVINDCGVAESNSVTVNVYSELLAGQVGADEQIAYNTVPTMLNTVTPPSGGTGSFSYQWQYSHTLDTWININNATNEAYQPPALTQTTYYRRRVTSGGCGTENSNIVTKTVLNAVTGGTIGTNQVMCYNTTPAKIENLVAPTGGNGEYSYKWEVSVNGTTWSEVVGFTDDSYQPGNATEKRYYRRMATAAIGGNAYSNVVIVDIYPDLVGAAIGSTQLICYDGIPEPVNIVTNASGGTGSYQYQWQQSSNGTTWTDIAGANNTYYEPGNLNSRTFYRLRTINQCSQINSNSVTINVSDEFSAGTIGDNQTVLYNGTPQRINVAVAPSGGDGSYTYQWQQSMNGSTWTNITGATSDSYQAGPLQQTTNYKRLTTSSLCGTKETNSVTVTITTDIVAGTIGNNQEICSGTTPERIITTEDPGGIVDVVYIRWERSSNGTEWEAIVGATTDSYQPGALTQTMHYRKVITVPGMDEVATNIVTITVEAPFTAPVISGSQTICYESMPNPLEITTAPAGGIGTYTYQWQQSSNGTIWANITGANNDTYEPAVLTQKTYYRLIVNNNCGNKPSNNISVSLYPVLVGGSIGQSQSVSYNGVPEKLAGEAGQGGNGIYDYQWQQSTNGATWTNIIGGNEKDYQPGALIADTHYRRLVSSGNCDNYISNNVTITVLDRLIPGPIGSHQSICYNTDAATLTGAAATGGTGTFTYQWQQSDNSIIWEDIVGATNEIFTPKNVLKSTYYRRAVTSGGSTESSNYILVSTTNAVITPQTNERAFYCQSATAEINVTNTFYNTYRWYDEQMQLVKEGSKMVIENVTSDKLFYVEAEDANNCRSIKASVQIKIDGVNADFTHDIHQVEIGSPVRFTNKSVNAVSFEWNFFDGDKIYEKDPWHYYNVGNSETSTMYDVELTAISENLCRSTKFVKDCIEVLPYTITSITEPGLGDKDEKLANEIIVGNPVTDELVVTTKKELKHIQVYSITGSLVLTTHKKITEVSDLAKGFYIVVIHTDDNIQKQVKIIKQ